MDKQILDNYANSMKQSYEQYYSGFMMHPEEGKEANINNELINIKIVCADSFFKRFKGLMLKRNIDFVLLFTDLISSNIHTYFMMSEIDVYFLDRNKIIFEKTSLKPWKFYKPEKKAKYILETKKDCLKLKIGDKLEFI